MDSDNLGHELCSFFEQCVLEPEERWNEYSYFLCFYCRIVNSYQRFNILQVKKTVKEHCFAKLERQSCTTDANSQREAIFKDNHYHSMYCSRLCPTHNGGFSDLHPSKPNYKQFVHNDCSWKNIPLSFLYKLCSKSINLCSTFTKLSENILLTVL